MENTNEFNSSTSQGSKTPAWERFKIWAKTKNGKVTLVLLGILLIALIAAGVVVYQRYFKKSTTSTGLGIEKKGETCALENTTVDSNGNRHPLAIVVENHPDARPQVGLDKASIVYEAVSEGGITRFLAIYSCFDAEKVGAVRSARTYFLDWLSEYNAFFAHCGGNIDALDRIPQEGILDLDQFKYGEKAYWREPEAGKASEHTLFTDTTKLYQIAQDNGWDMTGKVTSWKFKTDLALAQRPDKETVNVPFSGGSYAVKWVYNRAENQYAREIAGAAHNDAKTGEQLKVKNVIVMEVSRHNSPTRINEAGYAMDTIGSGKAWFFIDGKKTEGTWNKASRTERTIYKDSTGTEIKFNAGKFWIEVTPPEYAISSEEGTVPTTSMETPAE